MIKNKLEKEFFMQDAKTVAQQLLGMFLCREIDGKTIRSQITETECYFGKNDSASHASRGKTERNKPMFCDGGMIYVYLCYGIHNLFNIVTGKRNNPQAVLIRGTIDANGPGLVSKLFKIDKTLNGKSIALSNEIWVEKSTTLPFVALKRVGIGYAQQKDQSKLFRFVAKENKEK